MKELDLAASSLDKAEFSWLTLYLYTVYSIKQGDIDLYCMDVVAVGIILCISKLG